MSEVGDRSYYALIMSFWKKVSYELEYKNISRKELAHIINVPVATINRAMERDSNPYAIDALRISKALGVSLEYLLDFNDKNTSSKENELFQIEMYKKYHSVITILETLSDSKQKKTIEILSKIAEL